MVRPGKPLQESLSKPIYDMFAPVTGYHLIDIKWHEDAEANDPLVEMTAIHLLPGLYRVAGTSILRPASHMYRLNLQDADGDIDEYDLDYKVGIEESIDPSMNHIGPLAESMTEKEMSIHLRLLCIAEVKRQLDLRMLALENEIAGIPVLHLEYTSDPKKLDIDHIHIDEWLLKRKLSDGEWRNGIYAAELIIEMIENHYPKTDPAGLRKYVNTHDEEYISFLMPYGNKVFFGCQEFINEWDAFDGYQLRLKDSEGFHDMPESVKLAIPGKPLRALIETGDEDLDSRIIVSIEDHDPHDEEAELIVTLEPRLIRLGMIDFEQYAVSK